MPQSPWFLLVGPPSLFVIGFLVFIGRCALHGVPRSPRIDRLAGSKLVPRFILEYGYWFLQLPVRSLVRLRVSPDAITIGSLALAAAAAWQFALGGFGLGGWLLFASHTADALDGMVARATGVSSDRGEFLDALVDRYADFAIYLGVMWYFRDDKVPLALAAAALVGSSVMGYARAKGEAVGIDPNVGWMARHERGVALGSATVLSPLATCWLEPGSAHPRHYLIWLGLGLIALFTNITSIWRAQFVMARMPRPSRPEPSPGLAEER
jgi:CDP-diacylglycerol--glycerol-3-phosphate 3-phosphatidyltransferase